MSEETLEITTTEDWKAKALIVGGLVGALVGLAGAYLLIQQSDREGPPEISVGEGVKLGVWIFGLLRNIASL